MFHLVRPADELDDVKSKRGSIKDKSMTKAITEIYLTRLLSVKVDSMSTSAKHISSFTHPEPSEDITVPSFSTKGGPDQIFRWKISFAS